MTLGFNGNQTAFTGTVNVSSGTLRYGISSSGTTMGMGNAAFVVSSTAPGLQPRNSSATINLGSLAGSGLLSSANSPSSGTFTNTFSIGGLNTSTTFSGNFSQGALTNATAVTKVGTGTLSLSGVSTNNGATTVNAGALLGVTGGSLVNSAVTVATGATNGVTLSAVNASWTCSALTYNAGTCVALINFSGIAPSTSIAPLQVANNLTINGTLNVLVTGGSTTIPVGTYPLISYGGALTGAATTTPLALPNLIGGYITNDTANKWIALVVTNVTAPPTLVWSAGTGTWDFSSLNWTNLTTAALAAWADTNGAIFNDSASGSGPFTVTLNTSVNPVGTTFTNSAKDYTLTGTGSITGNETLTKTGTGTLTLVNSNTFTGATTISAGTLAIGNGGTAGSLANMAIVDNGALVINRSDAVAISGVITGTGSFTNQGGGTTTVSVTNTYAGNTTVKAGTLQMTDSGNLNPASTLVLSGGQFTRAAQIQRLQVRPRGERQRDGGDDLDDDADGAFRLGQRLRRSRHDAAGDQRGCDRHEPLQVLRWRLQLRGQPHPRRQRRE
jgi:autotransporter-associated beta strand protein